MHIRKANRTLKSVSTGSSHQPTSTSGVHVFNLSTGPPRPSPSEGALQGFRRPSMHPWFQRPASFRAFSAHGARQPLEFTVRGVDNHRASTRPPRLLSAIYQPQLHRLGCRITCIAIASAKLLGFSLSCSWLLHRCECFPKRQPPLGDCEPCRGAIGSSRHLTISKPQLRRNLTHIENPNCNHDGFPRPLERRCLRRLPLLPSPSLLPLPSQSQP